jgi:hypothetical protein
MIEQSVPKPSSSLVPVADDNCDVAAVVNPEPQGHPFVTGQTALIGTELQDAFERRSVAWIESEPDEELLNKRYCKIEDVMTDCETAQNFIAERMKD